MTIIQYLWHFRIFGMQHRCRLWRTCYLPAGSMPMWSQLDWHRLLRTNLRSSLLVPWTVCQQLLYMWGWMEWKAVWSWWVLGTFEAIDRSPKSKSAFGFFLLPPSKQLVNRDKPEVNQAAWWENVEFRKLIHRECLRSKGNNYQTLAGNCVICA